ncbi:MAG: S-layer homology domain-containing protein [Clostridia bacterium]|nr:S-layer homology domain-containing protein [Clostridia bacterium]
MNNKNIIQKLSLILAICLLLTSVPVFAARNQGSVIPGDNAKAPEAAKLYGYDTIITKGKDDSYYHVTWSSELSGTTEYIQWTEADKVVDGVFPANAYSAKASKSPGVCRGKMTDLKSDTDYAYRVGNDLTGWSEIYYTSVGNTEDNVFSFLAVGDPQVNSNVDGETWNISLEKAKNWFGNDVEFILSLGDQTNAGDDESQFDDFAYPEYLRSLPLITILGNHDDWASNYSEHFTYTDVDQSTTSRGGIYGGNYWVEHDGMLIITLNFQYESEAAHIAYTERAIEEYTAAHGDPVWTVVTFHDSLFSGADSRYLDTNEKRDIYSAAFSRMDVDAVFMGHDHIYTRTYMINSSEILDDADMYEPVFGQEYGSMRDPKDGDIPFFTLNSSSGSKFYEITDKALPFAANANQENIANITKVDVTPDYMAVYTYRCGQNNEIGDLVDFFAIHRSVDEDKYAPNLNVPNTTYYYTDDIPDLMAGITAYDNVDGDVTSGITHSGSIDPYSVSTVTYKVTDKAGNTATVERRFIPLDSEKLISSENTEWSYLDDGSCPFDFDDGYDEYRWTTEEFDYSNWKTAKGPFGSIDGELKEHSAGTPNTLINLLFPEGTDDEGAVIPNFFFRTTFDLSDPGSVEALIFDMWFDDAVTIYINGVMVRQYNCFLAGANMGYSGCDRDTPLDITSQHLPFKIDDKTVLDSLNLKEEGNIIAVELYQSGMNSDDIYFDLTSLTVQRSIKELPFTDVKPNHWFAPAVSYCVNRGYVTGMTETTFVPNGKLTRAQFLTILAKLDGVDLTQYETTDAGFTDVKTSHWYNEVVCWAVEKSYTSGISETLFGPNNNITRSQLARFFFVYSESKGIPTDGKADLSAFPDIAKLQEWARPSVEWAVYAGLISGSSKNGVSYLDPNGTATRAQAAVMFKAFDEFRK